MLRAKFRRKRGKQIIPASRRHGRIEFEPYVWNKTSPAENVVVTLWALLDEADARLADPSRIRDGEQARELQVIVDKLPELLAGTKPQ